MEAPRRSREVKCFKCLGHGHIASQCPTKRTMVFRNGAVVSESETSSTEEESDEEARMPEGDLLMVRRLLGSQVKEDEESQRENIFHSRCLGLTQGHKCPLSPRISGSMESLVSLFRPDLALPQRSLRVIFAEDRPQTSLGVLGAEN
ncbi:hypothetical protein Lal_00002537 [Lupinus albus]|nr:hypothetical protein Lal_00002537 [Lupinus albus]